MLFGDGAGAVVVSKTDQCVGLQKAKIGCDAKGRDILAVLSSVRRWIDLRLTTDIGVSSLLVKRFSNVQ
ncbi:3-oxoacyl-[acyl-carrier-protein] synthase KASIII [Vibrio astriarenae]|nr:3-oxoacyl-[acyl-carrier-protein] synthase KASIII [Vibrio sp. C7]